MSLPFLNGARKKYDLFVCCSPGSAKIYELALPKERIIVLQRPKAGAPRADWGVYLKALRDLRRLRADIGVTVWADVRVHLQMLLLGIPQRVGFSMNKVNYYAHELPVREKKLKMGESIQRVLHGLGLHPLTTTLQRGDYRQHHVDDWRQVAGALEIPWEVDAPWVDTSRMEIPQRAQAFFAKNAGRKIWFLHPGAGKEIRRWPHFDFIARELFQKRNTPLMILDDPTSPRIDVDYENCLHWPMGPLTDFFALASQCDFMLCNDTAATHVGTALRKHVITIFGPGSSDWFAPYTPHRTVIESNACPFRPCLDNCVQPTLVCLNDITQGRVATEIERLFESEDPRA